MLFGHEIRKIKPGFWEKYEEKGNNVLKKAIVQYIIEGLLPNNVTLNEIYEKIFKLSPIEQQSIIDSVKSTLVVGRLKTIEIIENDDLLSKSIVSGVGVGLGSLIARVNPLLGFSLGFFSSYAGNQLYNEYQKNKVNQHFDQQESRAMEVLEAIKTGSNSSLTIK